MSITIKFEVASGMTYWNLYNAVDAKRGMTGTCWGSV